MKNKIHKNFKPEEKEWTMKKFNEKKYWENRYKERAESGQGRVSGQDSYGYYAEWKGKILNDFIEEHNIKSILDFGCGDGNQIKLLKKIKYKGIDISKNAIRICKKRFIDDHTKSFSVYNPLTYNPLSAELGISLNVILHITTDKIFKKYIQDIFNSSNKYVIIYSSNFNRKEKKNYIINRKFTNYIEKNITGWELIQTIKTPGKNKEFYIYKKDGL